MIRRLILRPAAETDVRDVYRSLAEISVNLADRFVVQLHRVLERIESTPEMYGVVWQDVRAVRLRSFRYVVYYFARNDCTEVLAVLHGSRDESEWHARH